MSGRSHTIDGFAEDEQDVVGQAVAGVGSMPIPFGIRN